MKSVVFLDDMKESDIRPENTYNEYKQLLIKDIKKYFPDPSLLIRVGCPGCSDKNSKFVSNKMGFDYRACNKCNSLYVSPRPSEEGLRSFYKNSSSGQYQRKVFLRNTLESRSVKVSSYRIQWIMGLVEEYLPDAEIFLDYASRNPALLKQLNGADIFKYIKTFVPEFYEQDDLLPGNIEIIDNTNVIENSIDVFAAFEVVERVFDPGRLFDNAYAACRKNGLLIMTSTTSSGFEYQVLGECSPNLIAPDRLNLISLEALIKQIENSGFEVIEMSTPGRLDVEIVKKTYEKNPDMPLDPLWKYIFSYRDKNALHFLQEYLQQFQLSSHVRIAAIKK
jgi:hypothetical protein